MIFFFLNKDDLPFISIFNLSYLINTYINHGAGWGATSKMLDHWILMTCGFAQSTLLFVLGFFALETGAEATATNPHNCLPSQLLPNSKGWFAKQQYTEWKRPQLREGQTWKLTLKFPTPSEGCRLQENTRGIYLDLRFSIRERMWGGVSQLNRQLILISKTTCHSTTQQDLIQSVDQILKRIMSW